MSRQESQPSLASDSPSASDGGKVFWKSLEDKANPALAQARAEVEFPLGLEEASNASVAAQIANAGNERSAGSTVGRRGFMFFAGASAALFAEGCARRPVEKILPYSKAPEHVLPGRPSYYASVLSARGDALGVLVESHEGRPTKVEGNPAHPSSMGATSAFAQAAIYDLYDPDRSTTPMKRVGAQAAHAQASIADFDAALGEIIRVATADGGTKLRFLIPPTNSPTLLRLRDAVRAKLPKAQFHSWAPVNDANVHEGGRIAFGAPTAVLANLEDADVIVSLDSDFLGTETGSVRMMRDFAERRKLPDGPEKSAMNRLYVVEPTFTVTGMNADHRLRLAAHDIERYLLLLAKELSAQGVDLGGIKDVIAKADGAGIPANWLKVVAKDLRTKHGRSAILVGARQPARVHALAHAINAVLGSVALLHYSVADAQTVDPAVSIKQLVTDIDKSAVSALVILGGNPVYDAPFDVHFGDKLHRVATTVHVSSHFDETSEMCSWHVPRALELEAWGDQRALDGTVSIQQPLIAPLYNGRSDIEILARFAGENAPKGYDLVQATVRGSAPSPTLFTGMWNDSLKTGVIRSKTGVMRGQEVSLADPSKVRHADIVSAFAQAKAPNQGGNAPFSKDNLEITFAPCSRLYDGRYANNPILLELPDPLTKITWDNVALVSQKTADELGVQSRQMVRLTRAGADPVDVAMWIVPGQADHSIAVYLGWGRQKAGRYGNKHGFNVGGLRTTDAMWFASGLKVDKLGAGEIAAIADRYRRVGLAATDSPVAGRVRPDSPFDVETNLYKISQTQDHNAMEGRPIAIDATLEEYRKNALFPFFASNVVANDEHNGRKDIDLHNDNVDVRGSGSPDPLVPPLWPTVDYSQNQKWGMVIDLSACTGCSACVIACQVENNVPAVGKEQIERGREMSWLRIDRYFVGIDANDPQISFQPVACVQCEEAPCENVCPVNATAHSPEGLNDMAYNRCIGTRYCANNCPYKVRRFNFLNYHTSGGMYDDVPETEKMRFNPNVTVRMRGVMEKCSYCVQRIQEAKIRAKRTGKPKVGEGELKVACQQACPADAIAFGDLNDRTSRVARWYGIDRSYRLLTELGTRPRTTYLGKIRNPNPEMGA
ncbi:MAG: 4Fe-4S dicluster domain-containing protein [Polyangiaceae bacterium]|nr:4Fe-4S dicluster domain-containing protein [Polyangiaceae bacterium]